MTILSPSGWLYDRLAHLAPAPPRDDAPAADAPPCASAPSPRTTCWTPSRSAGATSPPAAPT
ncbi:MAG: hypothetical protein IT555_00710 [Acetobacteraceae bacterium]|nr:hypothetical protein [Acetobacteraceae bacterium]